MVSAGFKGGRTGFGWFQGEKDWFRVGMTGFGWFWLVPLFSNYQKLIISRSKPKNLTKFFTVKFFKLLDFGYSK